MRAERIRSFLGWTIVLQVVVAVVGVGLGHMASSAAHSVGGAAAADPAQELGALTLAVALGLPGMIAFTLLLFTVPALIVAQVLCMVGNRWRRRSERAELQRAALRRWNEGRGGE